MYVAWTFRSNPIIERRKESAAVLFQLTDPVDPLGGVLIALLPRAFVVSRNQHDPEAEPMCEDEHEMAPAPSQIPICGGYVRDQTGRHDERPVRVVATDSGDFCDQIVDRTFGVLLQRRERLE